MKSTSQYYPQREQQSSSRDPGLQGWRERRDERSENRKRSKEQKRTDRNQNNSPGFARSVARRVGEILQEWAESGTRGHEKSTERTGNWSEKSGQQMQESGERDRRDWRGQAPKGFQRSDMRIIEDACYELACAELDASEIEVLVIDGNLILSGTVPRREWKRMAEDTIEEVFGVENVQNELRFERQAESAESKEKRKEKSKETKAKSKGSKGSKESKESTDDDGQRKRANESEDGKAAADEARPSH